MNRQPWSHSGQPVMKPMALPLPTATERMPALRPVRRLSISDAIYDQLRDSIISGELVPGAGLPGERALSERFGAHRGAVREALKRLESAGLVSIHQGGHTRVLDFRLTAGLDFVTELMFSPQGGFDEGVLQSIAELASLIAPAIARLAALRRTEALTEPLIDLLRRMKQAEGEPDTLQELADAYWALLAKHGGNVAYQLILNTVREVSDAHGSFSTELPFEQKGQLQHLRAVAQAVLDGDAEAAERRVQSWIGRSPALGESTSGDVSQLQKRLRAARG